MVSYFVGLILFINYGGINQQVSLVVNNILKFNIITDTTLPISHQNQFLRGKFVETSQYQRIFQCLLNGSYSGLTDKNSKRVLRKTSKKYTLS